ncbi:MAG: patatin-like phospholipase family protein [Paludibacteraceae bacterium]|nr:patatin-like phospholipase family protein [Paludibacteraceae bacterium]
MAKKDVILTISGGGILGVGPAHFLKRLEEDMKKPLNKVFKGYAGTSTGSIIVAAINEGISTDEIEKLYKEKGKEIFKPWTWLEKVKALNKPLPKYNNAELKKMLKELLNGTCAEWKQEIYIPSIDMISSKNTEKVFDRGDKDIPKWFAVIASTSAPTYFMPAGSDENWLDGGLSANNPVAIGTAGYKKHTGKDDFKVVHIETGMLNAKKGKGGNKNLLDWGKYILKNFVARSESTNTYIAKEIVGEENVFVCEPTTTKSFEMDDLKCVDEVIKIWDEYYESVKKDLIKFLK